MGPAHRVAKSADLCSVLAELTQLHDTLRNDYCCRRKLLRGTRDWSVMSNEPDNSNDNDGDDEANNNKERLRRVRERDA